VSCDHGLSRAVQASKHGRLREEFRARTPFSRPSRSLVLMSCVGRASSASMATMPCRMRRPWCTRCGMFDRERRWRPTGELSARSELSHRERGIPEWVLRRELRFRYRVSRRFRLRRCELPPACIDRTGCRTTRDIRVNRSPASAACVLPRCTHRAPRHRSLLHDRAGGRISCLRSDGRIFAVPNRSTDSLATRVDECRRRQSGREPVHVAVATPYVGVESDRCSLAPPATC